MSALRDQMIFAEYFFMNFVEKSCHDQSHFFLNVNISLDMYQSYSNKFYHVIIVELKMQNVIIFYKYTIFTYNNVLIYFTSRHLLLPLEITI